MTNNINKIDRWVRVVLGIGLLSLVFIIQSGWRWVGLLGAVLLVTALINFCPIYRIFGFSTKKNK